MMMEMETMTFESQTVPVDRHANNCHRCTEERKPVCSLYAEAQLAMHTFFLRSPATE